MPIVATIVGCLALIAAVPITAGLASMSRLPSTRCRNRTAIITH